MSAYSNQEIPLDVDQLLKYVEPYEPENEWQALMEAPPGYEPAEPKNRYDSLVDVIRDCMELLTDQDRYIVEAVAYEQITFEELGFRLGCSAPHAWRLKQIAYEHLKEVLLLDGRLGESGLGRG